MLLKLQKIKLFYDLEYAWRFYLKLRIFKRKAWMSILSILFKFLNITLFNLPPSIKQTQTNNNSDQILSQLMDLRNLLEELSNNQILSLIILTLNIIIITYQIAYFIYLAIFAKFKNDKGKKSNFSLYLLSILLSFYSYVLFIPILRLSFSGETTALKIINFVLTIAIVLLLDGNDFHLNFHTEDYLSKKANSIYLLRIFVETCQIIAAKIFENNLNLIVAINILSSMVLFTANLIYQPYIKNQIQLLIHSMYFYQILFSAAILLFQPFENSQKTFSFYLLTLFPFGYLVSQILIDTRINLIIQKLQALQFYFPNQEQQDNIKLSANEIDIILRFLNQNMRAIYIDYAQNKYSILLEQIVLTHQLNCGNQRDCFCSNIKQNQQDDFRYQFLGDETRKKYIQDFTINLYKQKIKNEKNFFSQTKYGYYSYLLDVVSNEKHIQLEVIKLNNSIQLLQTSKGKQLFQILNYLALQKSSTTSKINQRANNQLNKNSQFLLIKEFSLYDIIIFDELLIAALKDFFLCLKLKVDVILEIGKNIVDLNQLLRTCKTFQIQKKKLFGMISKLAKQNNSNKNLKLLSNQYFYVISSEEKLKLEKKIQKNSVSEEIIKILNEQDSCALYISLLQKENQIVKVSQNFEKVFTNYSNSSIIGKTLNFILPKRFQDPHQNMLKCYSERTSFTKNLKKHPMQLGVDSEGFAVPYQLKLQNHQIGNDDIGLCGQIKKINCNKKYYISLFYNEESKDYEILTVSQNFYQAIFSKNNLSNQELYKINPISLIPILKFYLNTQESYLSYENIIVESVNGSSGTKQKKTNQYFESQYFEKKEIYYGLINQYKYKNKYVCIIQIEIENMQLILSNQLKQEVLEAFTKEVEQLEDALSQQSSQNLDDAYLNQIKIKDKQFSQRIFQTNSILYESKWNIQKGITQTNLQDKQTLDLIFHKNQQQQQQNKYQTCNTNSPTTYELSEIDQINSLRKLLNIEQNVISIASPPFSTDRTFQFLLSQRNNFEQETTPQNQTPRQEFLTNLAYQKQISIELNKDLVKNQNKQQISTSRGILSDSKFDNNQLSNQIQEYITDISPDKYGLSNQNFTQIYQMRMKSNQKMEKIKENIDSQIDLNIQNTQTKHQLGLKNKQIKQYQFQNSIYQILFIQCFREILQKIKSGKKTRSFLIINIFGIVSFLIVYLVQSANFISSLYFFENYSSSFDKSSWNTGLRVSFDSTFANYFLSFLLENNILLFSNIQQEEDIRQDVYQLNKELIKELNQDLVLIMNKNLGDDYQQNLILNTKEIIYFQNQSQSNIINTFLGYNLIGLLGDIGSNQNNYYTNQQDLSNLYDNFEKIRNSLLDINTLSTEQFSSSLNDKLDNNFYQFIYTLIFCMLITIFVISIHLYIESKREKTISLLSSFHPDELRKIITKIQQSLQSFNQYLKNSALKLKDHHSAEKNALKLNMEFLSFKASMDHIQNKIEKKRSFSDVIKLKKVRFSFISLVITTFLLLQFYSISAYFYLKIESQNLQDNSNFQGILNDSQYNLKYLEQLQYVSISAKFFPHIFAIDAQNYIITNQNTYYNQNSYLLNRLLDYQQSFRGKYTKRQNLYEDYLVKILESDLCDTIFKYPQYQVKDFKISQYDCINLSNGIFQQGLITAIKHIFDVEKQIINILQIDPKEISFQQFNEFQQIYQMDQFFKNNQAVSQIFELLQNFILQQTKTIIQETSMVYILLFTLQTLIILFLIFFGWLKYQELMQKQMIDSKKVLQIIDEDILLENKKIIQYFNTKF